MRNRRFQIEYVVNEIKVKITLRNWANENRHFFPAYTFEDRTSNFPITQVISRFLQNNYGFKEIEQNGEVTLRNSDLNFRF